MSDQNRTRQDTDATLNNGHRRPLSHILYDLSKPIPTRLLEKKPASNQSNEMLTFCPWHQMLRLMDHYTNGYFKKEIIDRVITKSHLMMTVRVYIEHQDGTVFREATGLESLNTKAYGDPQSNAESMAFRRACANFGLGLHLYQGEVSPDHPGKRRPKQAEGRPMDQGAKSSQNDAPTNERPDAKPEPQQEKQKSPPKKQDQSAATKKDEPGSCDSGQLEAIRKLGSQKNVHDDRDLVKGINELVDSVEREIKSLDDLSFNEAARTLTHMQRKKEHQTS